jgi:hypothetical protein
MTYNELRINFANFGIFNVVDIAKELNVSRNYLYVSRQKQALPDYIVNRYNDFVAAQAREIVHSKLDRYHKANGAFMAAKGDLEQRKTLKVELEQCRTALLAAQDEYHRHHKSHGN